MNSVRRRSRTMTEKEMWNRFCAESGIAPDTPYEA